MRAQKPPAETTAGITDDTNAEEYSRGGVHAGGGHRSGTGGGDNSNFKEGHNTNNSSDDDVRGSSDSDDDVLAYVRDDIAREYARVLPDEQMSMQGGGVGGWVGQSAAVLYAIAQNCATVFCVAVKSLTNKQTLQVAGKFSVTSVNILT